MAEASIPVDLANPGQVFACLGFVETADVLLGAVQGGFDWSHGEASRFRLATDGDENPIKSVLRFLDCASVTSAAPAGSSNDTDSWGIETVTDDSGAFPFGDPSSPATLPARLEDSAGRAVTIDYWGDQTGRDNVKFWGGSGGYPGAALARDALNLIDGRAADQAEDPFSLSAEQSSSFRFDWRRDYLPIDVGFSPNAHDHIVMQGYPVVELLAAVGLTHSRPSRRSRLEYSYGVAGVAGERLHDPIFLRAALGIPDPPSQGWPFRRFTMRLAWPGQEGQARCIVHVNEDVSQT